MPTYNSHFRCGPIAQLVEQLTLNQRVAGSSPARLTIIFNKLYSLSNHQIWAWWATSGPDLCRLTIEQYRQDTILYELFSGNLEKVETHLATERLKLDQDASLFDFFSELKEVLEPAREELLKRIRKDTSVVLHIAGKHGKVKSISDIFGSF